MEYRLIPLNDLSKTIKYLKAYKITLDENAKVVKSIPFQKKSFEILIDTSNQLSILISNFEEHFNNK